MAQGIKTFSVDYTYTTQGGTTTRTQLQASNVSLPMLATSETAVLSWLKSRHQASEVNIITLTWL